MYNQDSFFTLTMSGRIGLILLSVAMSIAVLVLCWRLARRHRIWYRVVIAMLLFVGFIWLAPQIYYTYYIFLFGDLPWQIVVQAPPTPAQLLDLVLFRDRANLSHHSQGLLGWLLVATALIAPRISRFGFIQKTR